MTVQKVADSKHKIDLSLLPKLVKLGFSKQEAQIYLTLIKDGILPAKEIAKRMNILPHAVYRIIKKLEKKKLVTIITSSPLTFYVLPSELALSAYVKEKSLQLEREAKEINTYLTNKPTQSSSTKIDVIAGKQEFFTASESLIRDSKKEVLIISIGEPSTSDLILVDKRAIERGVIIRMIAHKYDKENKEFLENLKKNGLEIRHFPDWGFHLQVVDGEKSLLAVNNPQNPKERITVKINSLGLSKALRDYFYSIWEKAIKI
jgi:sugar-specific transcriptional regulator TrmB